MESNLAEQKKFLVNTEGIKQVYYKMCMKGGVEWLLGKKFTPSLLQQMNAASCAIASNVKQ